MFLYSPTRSFDRADIAVDETVEDSRCSDVVSEVLSPLVPLDVGGDDGGMSSLIASGDDLVEEVGIVGLAVRSSNLVDEQVTPDEGFEGLFVNDRCSVAGMSALVV